MYEKCQSGYQTGIQEEDSKTGALEMNYHNLIERLAEDNTEYLEKNNLLQQEN